MNKKLTIRYFSCIFLFFKYFYNKYIFHILKKNYQGNYSFTHLSFKFFFSEDVLDISKQ